MRLKFEAVNFVVMRSAGLPIQTLKNFSFEKSIELIKNNAEEKKVIESIKNENNSFCSAKENISKKREFRDMVRASSPQYNIFLRRLKEAKGFMNQYERKMVLYIQRAATKCGTAGSYGPVAIGCFGSENNIEVTLESAKNYVLLEGWALDAIAKSLKLNLSEKEFHDIMEFPAKLLEKTGNSDVEKFVGLVNLYAALESPNAKDLAFEKINRAFKKIAEQKKQRTEKIAGDYESRAVIYELAKRNRKFAIGSELEREIKRINELFGNYLAKVSEKLFFEKEQENEEEFLFKNFARVSEGILKEKDWRKKNSRILPPIFSPDIAISAKNIDELNKGKYKIVLGEIHVAPTLFSSPMYAFERNRAIEETVKKMPRKKISLVIYSPNREDNFTQQLPVNMLKEIVAKVNGDKEMCWAYRAKPECRNSTSLLFFPLAIGRKLIFFDKHEKDFRMWSSEYLPQIILRLLEKFAPEIHKKAEVRKTKIVETPEFKAPKKLNEFFMKRFIGEYEKWREENNVPKHVFFRYSPVRQPLFVDFSLPHLVYEFFKIAGAKQKVSFTKFSPNENETWFGNSEENFCTEFRYMVIPNA
ncbi:MAG: hypothetical protein JW772_02645 [Candidatus Diapherotrites archaeon]|nr:hypothetical protein [Candidatus Diapherotrites archaeon]